MKNQVEAGGGSWADFVDGRYYGGMITDGVSHDELVAVVRKCQ